MAQQPPPATKTPKQPPAPARTLPFALPPKKGDMEAVSMHYARRRLRWLSQFDLTVLRSELEKGSLVRTLLKGTRGGEHAANHYYRVLRDSRGPDQADKEAEALVAPSDQTDASDQIPTALVQETRDALEEFLASPEGKPFASE